MSKGLPKHAYALKAGRQLGPYRVVRPLGAGGMGEVYLAEHVHMNSTRSSCCRPTSRVTGSSSTGSALKRA